MAFQVSDRVSIHIVLLFFSFAGGGETAVCKYRTRTLDNGQHREGIRVI